MIRVQKGDRVSIHYTAKLGDGTVVDKTPSKEPLTFTLGEGKVLPAVDNAVLGMAPGESKTVEVSENDLYGPHNPDLVVELDRTEFTKRGIEPEIGLKLNTNEGKEKSMVVRVTDISNTTVTLDANHPLAGHSLAFDLYLAGVG